MVTIIPTYFFAIEINPDLFLLWENYLVTKKVVPCNDFKSNIGIT